MMTVIFLNARDIRTSSKEPDPEDPKSGNGFIAGGRDPGAFGRREGTSASLTLQGGPAGVGAYFLSFFARAPLCLYAMT